MPYIIQSILILLGPAFFAGSIYMVLGRLIQVLEAGDYSLIRVKWLTKLFLLGDILSIFGQAGGASTGPPGLSDTTFHIGSFIQVLEARADWSTFRRRFTRRFQVQVDSGPRKRRYSYRPRYSSCLL